MGLDISTKNDYSRFNWKGARSFMEWSDRKLKCNPFPNWDGGNGTTVVFHTEPQDLTEVKGNEELIDKWITAFKKYVGNVGDENLFEYGKGQLIGEFGYRAYDLCYFEMIEKHNLKDEDSSLLGYKYELKEWDYIQAWKWYFVMLDAKECGYINYY